MRQRISATLSHKARTSGKGKPMTDWKTRIVVDPDILVGKPTVKGTRIAVELILDRLSDGWTMEDILTSYPTLTREDVLAALSFTAELFKEETFVAINKVAA